MESPKKVRKIVRPTDRIEDIIKDDTNLPHFDSEGKVDKFKDRFAEFGYVVFKGDD
jgi:hypothetical protein